MFQRADLAIADITITRERERDADFTDPIMNLGQSFFRTISCRGNVLNVEWNRFVMFICKYIDTSCCQPRLRPGGIETMLDTVIFFKRK